MFRWCVRVYDKEGRGRPDRVFKSDSYANDSNKGRKTGHLAVARVAVKTLDAEEREHGQRESKARVAVKALEKTEHSHPAGEEGPMDLFRRAICGYLRETAPKITPMARRKGASRGPVVGTGSSSLSLSRRSPPQSGDTTTLESLFDAMFTGTIEESSPAAWARLYSLYPTAVGIDCEGTNTSPPLLVQIATSDMVILEVTKYGFSKELRQLLKDKTITKVFCDGHAGMDKRLLGLSPSAPDVVDLEDHAPGGVRGRNRGLAKLVQQFVPEVFMRRVLKDKNGWMHFECGRGRIHSLSDISREAQRYAAADAFFTHEVYQDI
ncbi:hypothetical protein KIPB_006837 [Kipferlia bialata]|uniref:3'-5' exonuclease domain-containing protein n=1 Tax=Kipferlia bialata TaxID=797122 RepID=A0A9K3CYC4_9EUKA|nr:hypothetical protein KIPB_006837 [Kipferlia bialata]|eukprot:g6837.t1